MYYIILLSSILEYVVDQMDCLDGFIIIVDMIMGYYYVVVIGLFIGIVLCMYYIMLCMYYIIQYYLYLVCLYYGVGMMMELIYCLLYLMSVLYIV